MHLKTVPPPIPPDLLAPFGTPDHAFGPNRRFRVASVLLGALLLALGIGMFVEIIVMRNARGKPGGFEGMVCFVIGGLLLLGSYAVYYPLWMPANWLYVCPNGLIRRLNGDWEGLPWADVARFQDLGETSGMAAIRQCRVVTTDGREWGFIAEWVADYGQLKRVLRERVEARQQTATG